MAARQAGGDRDDSLLKPGGAGGQAGWRLFPSRSRALVGSALGPFIPLLCPDLPTLGLGAQSVTSAEEKGPVALAGGVAGNVAAGWVAPGWPPVAHCAPAGWSPG